MPGRLVVLAAIVLLGGGCGGQPEPNGLPRPEEVSAPIVVRWLAGGVGPRSRLAPEQVAAAREHRLPVTIHNSLHMRFRLIPAGTFWMGSPTGEAGREADETRHAVTLTRPYYMQVNEVTNAQYKRWFAGHDSGRLARFWLGTRHQPVAGVSWHAATAFARWLSASDPQYVYRLPTEAEWEYACRAGTSTRFWWGDGVEDGHLRANANDPLTKKRLGFPHAGWGKDDGYRVSAPVGTFPDNAWGLHDMSGNVWEWCSDWAGPYPQGPVTDPAGPPTGTRRILRGGSWDVYPALLRCANRRTWKPGEGWNDYGFRLVVERRE